MAEKPKCKSECKAPCELRREVIELRELVVEQATQLNRLLESHEAANSSLPTSDAENCDGQQESPESTVQVSNPRIKDLKLDKLYHLGLDTCSTDFPKQFGDVKIVCLGSSTDRLKSFAKCTAKEINEDVGDMDDLAKNGQGFPMYKVGPVLFVSHGSGSSSMSAILNELIRMMYHARCQDPIFIRIGSSAGLDLLPGSVVITEETLDDQMRNSHEVIVQGKPQQLPTVMDQQLACELSSLSKPEDGFDAIIGKTMCFTDYYESQGRTDGAFADYSEEDKVCFLNKLANKGVHNMDMESGAFAALTAQAKIRSVNLSLAKYDRLDGDEIKASPEDMKAWEVRPQMLVSRFIRKTLKKGTSAKCCANCSAKQNSQ